MLDGRIVHEQYRQPGDEAERWRLASGTKFFSGVAAAAAVQDGLLSLDERVSDTLTEWGSDGRRDITMRQLLSLSSHPVARRCRWRERPRTPPTSTEAGPTHCP
jgi:CubicO group peptidase (beta-lactamase class C family)